MMDDVKHKICEQKKNNEVHCFLAFGIFCIAFYFHFSLRTSFLFIHIYTHTHIYICPVTSEIWEYNTEHSKLASLCRDRGVVSEYRSSFNALQVLLSFTESQNGGGWQGPLWVTQPNPLPKQGHPEQAAQHRGQAGLESLQL